MSKQGEIPHPFLVKKNRCHAFNIAAYFFLIVGYATSQARIQEFTLVGAPWIGDGSGDRQGPQRVQGSARWGAREGRSPPEAHEN